GRGSERLRSADRSSSSSCIGSAEVTGAHSCFAGGVRVAASAASLGPVVETIEAAPTPRRLSPRVLSGLGWSTAGRFAALPAGAVANVLVARALPPSDVGAYFVIVNLVSILALVSMLGLNQAVVRGVSEAMTRGRPAAAGGVVRTALRFTAIVSVAL